MTGPNMLQRLLDGQPAPCAPVDEEVGRLFLLAVALHADAGERTVAMRPRARTQLRDRLLMQVAKRPAPPSAPVHHDVAGWDGEAVSRCDRRPAGHPRQAVR